MKIYIKRPRLLGKLFFVRFFLYQVCYKNNSRLCGRPCNEISFSDIRKACLRIGFLVSVHRLYFLEQHEESELLALGATFEHPYAVKGHLGAVLVSLPRI